MENRGWRTSDSGAKRRSRALLPPLSKGGQGGRMEVLATSRCESKIANCKLKNAN